MRGPSLSSLCHIVSLAAAATSVSRVVELDGQDYFLPPISPWRLKLNSSDRGDDIIPFTVVQTNASHITTQLLLATLEEYNKTDDVWTPSFASAIYIDYRGESTPSFDVDESVLASEYGNETDFFYSWEYGSSKDAAPGPYFLDETSGKVYQAYGLFPDSNQAFIQATYQDENEDHHNLKAGSVAAGGLTIAVPSRLYFTKTEDKPLAGVRLAVKDLYDLKGVKTSGGNRALFEMTSPANVTAAAVQSLIDAGAVVVGKNKLSEFAYAGQYHLDHVDYLLPFNPRGDGYNTPGDSSGGSAASVAAYDWLDVSMASDTGGSIRGPALANGVFGNRPSQDAASHEGVIPLSKSMDTTGTIARNPELWALVNKVLYENTTKEYTSFPRSIYLPTSYNVTDLQQGAQQGDPSAVVIIDFFQALAKYLNATIENISLDTVWNRTSPHQSVGNATLAEAVDSVYGNLTTYEHWNQFGKGYLEAYTAAHDGEMPYVTPNTISGWFYANATQTTASHEEDLKWKQYIVDFASSDIFRANEESCADSIMVYPNVAQKFYRPNFDPMGIVGDISSHDANPYILAAFEERDYLAMRVKDLTTKIHTLHSIDPESNSNSTFTDTPQSTGPPSTPDSTATDWPRSTGPPPTPASQVAPGRFASVAGLPDYAITIGAVILEQNYSNRTQTHQRLPVGIDIVSRRGCDFMIQNLISALHKEGILKAVRTGAEIY